MLSILSSFALFSTLTAATCDCGFSVNATDSPAHQIFTEFIETDFTQGILGGWIPQNYLLPRELARGPYGKNASSENVVPSKQGLQLWVKRLSGDFIPMAEIATQRTDMLYGSFRIKAKLTGVNGTCAGLFWFHNDTVEIDMEFLSKDYENGGRVNLVNQSPASEAAGFNAAHTPGFAAQRLPFRPDGDFHEYRFDWIPGSISFYADGILLKVLTQDIPSTPGHMLLNHWSNGNLYWSAGPPVEDTAITIQYTHLYFNSSDPRELKRFNSACPKYDAAKVCKIQDSNVALKPPVSTTGNSFVPPWDGPGSTPSAPDLHHAVKTYYVIVGVSIGLAFVLFVCFMCTVRYWDNWRLTLFRRGPSSADKN
ncbi:glycoside hydrolase family protein [Venturia nashicola]|nr:glycoside hydrolase family protein [Venturia nashicola]